MNKTKIIDYTGEFAFSLCDVCGESDTRQAGYGPHGTVDCEYCSECASVEQGFSEYYCWNSDGTILECNGALYDEDLNLIGHESYAADIAEFKKLLSAMSKYNAAESTWIKETVQRNTCKELLKIKYKFLKYIKIDVDKIINSGYYLISETDYK